MSFERTTPCGVISGTACQWPGIAAYKGIRYATAGRWEFPIPVTHWDGVYDATQYGACCYQPRSFYNEAEMPEKAFYYKEFRLGETYTYSEDCLFLNIWTPADAGPESKLPVIFYIHGGGFNGGCGHEKHFDGPEWPTNGCVAVTINYRLGPLGFVCLDALQQEAGHTGNYALFDQLTALQWVRANIAAFGGDADNITLCGFSDGGRMAAALAGSPLFRERFQKAVAISGGLSLADPDAAAQKLAENFAPLAVEDGRFADTASAAEWLLTPGADVREWLCGLEPARIAALGKPAILYADDVVLSRDARSAVPLLLLSSATEFSGFVRDDLRPASSAARAYAVKYGSALCRWSSTEAVAEALGGSAPVWLGLIDYGGTDSQTAIPGLGSFHGLPLALFSSESSYSACADLSSAGAQALSAQLKQALAGFMTSGSPGWDAWTPQDRDALHFDADSETACITFNSYPDTQESIRAAMAADTSLSAAEKETVEHLYFSGFSF